MLHVMLSMNSYAYNKNKSNSKPTFIQSKHIIQMVNKNPLTFDHVSFTNRVVFYLDV